MKNLCAKAVKSEQAYEVWQNQDGTWTYYVLKKYQSPEKEAQNPYARWFCRVTSPATTARGDYGDVYVSTVKNGTHLIDNPLTHQDDQTTGKEQSYETLDKGA